MKKTYLEFHKSLLNSNFYNDIHSDMYWNKNFSSDKVLELFEKEAEQKGIELTDLDSFDYDVIFFETYTNDSDKSLS